MSFNITQFTGTFKNGGARPSLFSVSILPPDIVVGVIGEDFRDLEFLVEAAQLPPSNLGVIQVPYFGRIIKLAGDRTFEPWTVTVLNDENFKVRNALETWSTAINGLENNKRERSGEDIERSYKQNATITQFSKTGDKLRTYKFHGMFPQVIGAIDLSWESLDQVERFQVTFEYDYFTVERAGPDSGNTTVTGNLVEGFPSP